MFGVVNSSFISVYLASKNMSFKSRLARNMNIFECNLISVIAWGGNEWPTATRPTVSNPGYCLTFK